MGCATSLCPRLTHFDQRFSNAHFIACFYHPQYSGGDLFIPTETPARCNGRSGRCNNSEQCVPFQSGGDESRLAEVQLISSGEYSDGFYCGEHIRDNQM